MPILIPIVREQNGPAWILQQAVIEGVTYTLDILWNERAQAWFMGVWDVDYVTPLQVGIRLVADYPLRRWTVNRSPTGNFVLIDTGAPAGTGVDPGFDDLGNRHQLHYFTFDELPQP